MKNLNIEKIKEISKIKKEPSWMTDFRINAFNAFENLSNPKFGPELKIDFDIINYYNNIFFFFQFYFIMKKTRWRFFS